MSESDLVFQHVLSLGDATGWHQKDGVVMQVGHQGLQQLSRLFPHQVPKRKIIRYEIS